jgi:hypothetical protein
MREDFLILKSFLDLPFQDRWGKVETEADDALERIKAEYDALREFFDASWAYERGIIDFDLHAAQVDRLTKAQEAAYRILYPPQAT